jgi:hypothetical protein
LLLPLRGTCVRAAVLCLTAMAAPGLAADTPTISGSQIKAAFLYNFTKFVAWPAERFDGGRDSIVIGVMGDSLLAAELESIVEDRRVNGRTILVREVHAEDELESVHVLFVGAAEDARFAAVRPGIEGAAILTVGETPAFAGAGGVISFVSAGSKLRFEIDMIAAGRARLKISAQLQELATAVKQVR